MNVVATYFRDLWRGTLDGWNRFWFTPADPALLGLVRILAGSMLFYTHLVWGRALEAFFLPNGWLGPDAVGRLQGDGFAWSHWWLIDSPAVAWPVHLAALAVLALFTLGLWTRITSVLSFLITVSYANRATGALFGLDQINTFLAMYLSVGPAGDAYSLDRLWRSRRAGHVLSVAAPSVSANLATRLLQVHMCVIYLFAGLSKLGGANWWAGTAFWGAAANLEYQSLDLVFLVHHPLLVNALTLGTLAWEISYCALVWPRLTRPLVIAMSIPLHMGIAAAMGMVTFGVAMLFGNMAFVSPRLVRSLLDAPFARLASLVIPRATGASAGKADFAPLRQRSAAL